MGEVREARNYVKFYDNWVKKGCKIKYVSDHNAKIIARYVLDMSSGHNVAPGTKKGPRTPTRLLAIKSKMTRVCKMLESGVKIGKDTIKHERIIDITDKEAMDFINALRDGKVNNYFGKPYKSVDSTAKTFTAFWHWWQRFNRKNYVDEETKKKNKNANKPTPKNKEDEEIRKFFKELGIEPDKSIEDITLDIVKKADPKPDWVYLDEQQFKKYVNHCKYDYKVLFTFMYDAGIRAPKELINVMMPDLEYDTKNKFYQLTIRPESSKTFGRKIKLMLCSDLLKNYIEEKKLKSNDYLFNVNAEVVNRYMQRLAFKLFGDEVSKARKQYKHITWYDLRHCSACYWLIRYKSEAALKYRFGWKKSDMLHYYSEFLGMHDTISKDDLIVDVSASELQKELEEERKQRLLLEEQMKEQEKVKLTEIEERKKQADEIKKLQEKLEMLGEISAIKKLLKKSAIEQ
jgi:hypothetical protein